MQLLYILLSNLKSSLLGYHIYVTDGIAFNLLDSANVMVSVTSWNRKKWGFGDSILTIQFFWRKPFTGVSIQAISIDNWWRHCGEILSALCAALLPHFVNFKKASGRSLPPVLQPLLDKEVYLYAAIILRNTVWALLNFCCPPKIEWRCIGLYIGPTNILS